MRIVIQRVLQAEISVGGRKICEIGKGCVVLLGIGRGDVETDAESLAVCLSEIRIFNDEAGKMNLNLRQVAGSLMIVPNFTLLGDCSRGRRPSFTAAARPEYAGPLFHRFVTLMDRTGIPTRQGIFGADMRVSLVNDGPVTLVVDSTDL